MSTNPTELSSTLRQLQIREVEYAPAPLTPKELAEREAREARQREEHERGLVELAAKRKRAEELYAPAVQQLAHAVSALLAALETEDRARTTLAQEGSWGVGWNASLEIRGPRGDDWLRDALEYWLREARANGFEV